MTRSRPTKHAWLKRLIALVVFAVFAQTLAAALMHVALVEHVWCESHGGFEHRATTQEYVDAPISAESLAPRGLDSKDEHMPEERGASDLLCFYLTSLYGPAIPQPPMVAEWTSLPPPGELALPSPMALDAAHPAQIELLHLAPGLSPPSRIS